MIFVTLEVKTTLVGGTDAQFQKIPDFYEISRHFCVDFFLGHAVECHLKICNYQRDGVRKVETLEMRDKYINIARNRKDVWGRATQNL